MHANQIKQWKDQLLEGATGVFGDETKAEPAGSTVDVKTLHAKIGELTLENDFLAGALGKAGLLGGQEMIDRPHKLSVTMEEAFCIEAVEEALARYGKPDIFKTDRHTIGASSRMV